MSINVKLGYLSALAWTREYSTTQVSAAFLVLAREITRNSKSYSYDFKLANEKSSARRSSASKIPKKMKVDLKARVLNCLGQDWSPEQISGRLKLKGICISHESIYECVRKDKTAGGSLYKHLRHGGRKYKKRCGKSAGVRHIPNRVDIAERPAVVDEKSRIGDWEGDTVVSTESRAHLVTLVDRCSKFLIVRKIGKKTMENTNNAIINSLKKHRKFVNTITFDNGSEFAGHGEIAKKLKTEIYFARPYKSCDRGLNEHTNGLIRQYLPKKFDFKYVMDKKIREIQNLLNNRPRKVLNFHTPFEVFFDQLFQLEDASS
ncbi:MAG: IS30 family transposase [Holosporaceae bacterium]|nr:IS30 family transposase [Holosporaceae bacterium]